MPRHPAYDLDSVNKRLKDARTGFQVWQRGNRLSLRGTLPPKPGVKRDGSYQQTIALGVYANPAGFEFAEAKAQELSSLIAQHRFTWQAVGIEEVASGKCKAWISRFKKDWLSRQVRSPEESEVVWADRFWLPAFKWLDPDEELAEAACLRVLQRFEVNSRSRQLACQKLAQLLEFAAIKSDLRQYQGSYSAQQVKPRDLPTDDAIAEWYEKFTDPGWQRVYALLAVYGLRPHEAFFCQQDKALVLKVLKGKTGDRMTWALPPAWVEEWKLGDPVELPNVKGRTHREYGNRVGQYFRRIGLPWGAYDLRHAWCIRASLFLAFRLLLRLAWLGTQQPSIPAPIQDGLETTKRSRFMKTLY